MRATLTAGSGEQSPQRHGEIFRLSNRRAGSRSTRPADDGAKLARCERIDGGHVGRSLQNLGDYFLRRRARKERASGQHFVEDAAEGEDVRAAVDPLPVDLLRRHVAESAEHGTADRVRHGRAGRRVCGTVEAVNGEAEIENLHVPVAGQENVFRLEIAVHDAARVRSRQSVCDRGGDVDRVAPRQGTLLHPLPQILPLEQLHDRAGSPSAITIS